MREHETRSNREFCDLSYINRGLCYQQLIFFLQMALLYSFQGFFNFNPTQREKLREIEKAPSKYVTQNPAVTIKVQNWIYVQVKW